MGRTGRSDEGTLRVHEALASGSACVGRLWLDTQVRHKHHRRVNIGIWLLIIWTFVAFVR